MIPSLPRAYRRLGLLAALCALGGSIAAAAEPEMLRVATGRPGSSADMFGIGLSSLAKVDLVPQQQLDVTLVREDGTDNLALLAADRADLAILPHDQAAAADGELRGVMMLWPAGALTDDEPARMLVARAAVDEQQVFALTQAIFANTAILEIIEPRTAQLTVTTALAGLPLPLHEGAWRYYAGMMDEASLAAALQDGAAFRPAAGAPAATEAAADAVIAAGREAHARTFVVHFDHDKADIKGAEMQFVAAACEYATTLPEGVEFQISGHTDLTGPMSYNDVLGERRADAVATMIRNDPRFHAVAGVMSFGENEPVVPTPDGIAEPRNRRVEIRVLPRS